MSQLSRVCFIVAAVGLGGCTWGKRISALEETSQLHSKQMLQATEQIEGLETRADDTNDKMQQSVKELASLYGRVDGLDVWIKLVESRLEELRAETRGVGVRYIIVRPANGMTVLYGNQSGFNASVDVTNKGTATSQQGKLLIRTSRIPKPSDSVSPPAVVGSILPADATATKELDLSQQGASRRLIVPCGFQIEGVATFETRINIRLKYEEARCLPE